jgi:asparagine N-glycosylation enzyme membrane subunit Stt3
MGFEAPGGSLTKYGSDPAVCGILSLLIVLGGLGFLVWDDILRNPRPRKWSVYTKLVVVTNLVLIFGGALMLYALLIRIIGFDMIPRNWAVQATDQNAYAKQFSRVLAILSLSPILSGIAGLIWGEGICGILLGVLSLALIFLCVKLFSPRKDDK